MSPWGPRDRDGSITAYHSAGCGLTPMWWAVLLEPVVDRAPGAARGPGRRGERWRVTRRHAPSRSPTCGASALAADGRVPQAFAGDTAGGM